jgi:hypothetical protein
MAPPDRERPGATHSDRVNPEVGSSPKSPTTIKATTAGRPCVSSGQVSWWSVHEFVAPVLSSVESWPMVGTPEWCALDDADPVKVAALFDAAQHWALRVETCQQAHCDASREISGAVDWSALAREINQRADFYASRPWLRRVAS